MSNGLNPHVEKTLSSASEANSSGSALLFRERVEALTKVGAKTALQKLRQVLHQCQRKNDPDGIGWALINSAMVLRGQRQFNSLFKILEEAQNIFTNTENQFGLACVAFEMSLANREFSRNSLALEYGQKAARMFQELGRTMELGWAYDNLSVIHSNRYERHESLSYAKKAHGIFVEFNSQNGFAWNACNLARLYLEMGFYGWAHRHYFEALEAFEKMNNQQGKAWSLLGLGMVQRAQCQFEAATESLNKAQVLYEELELKDRVGWCLLNLAAIKRAAADEEEAISLNKKAIRIFGPMRNSDGVAWGIFQNAQIYRDRGQLVKAWQTAREGLNLHTDVSNRSGMGWAENEMGRTYLELGDLAHARECFIKCKVQAEQIDAGSLKAEADKNLALLNLEEGFLQKAVELLDKAEMQAQKIESREIEIEVLLARTRYWIILGDAKRAYESLQSANAFVEAYGLKRMQPTVGVCLGEVLAMSGKTEEAITVWQETATQAKKFQQRKQRAEALLGLVQLQQKVKSAAQLSLALFHVEKDIRAVGTRKLKAKFLAIKGMVSQSSGGFLDGRFFNQSLHILTASNLSVIEKQVLDTTIAIFRQAGQYRETDDYARDARLLLEKGSVDLHLVRPRSEWLHTLPVSLAV